MTTSASAIGSIECPTCRGKGLVVTPPVQRVSLELDRLLSQLPRQDTSKGQVYFSAHGVASLLSLMILRGDVEAKRIACLTTPVVALGLSLLGKGTAERVVALDLDRQLLDYMHDKFKVEIEPYDIRDNIPRRLRGEFDRFVIDPFYAEDHYHVCISRALDLVGPKIDRAGYVVVPPRMVSPVYVKGDSPLPLGYAVSEHLVKSGLYITEMHQGLVQYNVSEAEAELYKRRFGSFFRGLGYDEPWRASDVIRVETTSNSKALVPGEATLKVPVTSGPRLGHGFAYVELPSSDGGIGDCRLCRRCCYGALQRRMKVEPQKAAYIPPALEEVPVSSWRLEDRQLVAAPSTCRAFGNLVTDRVVVLQGPTSRHIYEQLQAAARAHPQPPQHAWLEEQVGTALEMAAYGTMAGHIEDRCLRFAIQMINVGLMDWDRVAD